MNSKSKKAGGIWTVFWSERDEVFGRKIDNNAVVRAKSKAEAMRKIKKQVGAYGKYGKVKIEAAYALSLADALELGVTTANIKEMDAKGYYLYDSGT